MHIAAASALHHRAIIFSSPGRRAACECENNELGAAGRSAQSDFALERACACLLHVPESATLEARKGPMTLPVDQYIEILPPYAFSTSAPRTPRTSLARLLPSVSRSFALHEYVQCHLPNALQRRHWPTTPARRAPPHEFHIRAQPEGALRRTRSRRACHIRPPSFLQQRQQRRAARSNAMN